LSGLRRREQIVVLLVSCAHFDTKKGQQSRPFVV
jgi:hypothetical protein